MAKIKINGAEIEYTEKGSGEPLVLVHGSASDCRTWKFQGNEFSKSFRTISYSRRYHWPNKVINGGEEYSMNTHVNDLKKLLFSLGAVPANLIGHSYGAFVCMLLAIKNPELVKTLVLAEPPAITLFVSNHPKSSEIVKLLFSRPGTAFSIIKFGVKGVVPAARYFRRGNIKTAVRIYGDAVFGVGGFEKLSESREKQVFDNITNIKAELLGPGFESLQDNQIRKLRIPSLLLTGENSISLFQNLVNRLMELLPNYEYAEIKKAGHNMHEDNAEEYNKTVLSFVKKHNNK